MGERRKWVVKEHKGSKDKAKVGKDGGWEVGVSEAGDSGGRKMETAGFEQK